MEITMHKKPQHLYKNCSIQSNFGFTLVELVVGLFLSIFIVGIAFTYFVSSSQTFRVQTSESIMQENARFAIEILTQNLRLAGLNPSNDAGLAENLGTILTANICSDTEAGLADGANGGTQCTIDNLAGNPTSSDRISVAYILEADEADISVRGCNNVDINVDLGERARLTNTLWSAPSPNNAVNGARSLYCQTYNLDTNQAVGPPLPLVDGVDSIQFQYGVDTNGDGVVDRYQPISAVADLRTIKTVRAAMLVSNGLAIESSSNTEDVLVTRIYNLLDVVEITFNDRKPRQIFSTTVLIPNTI